MAKDLVLDIREQPDGSLIFELADEVWAHVSFPRSGGSKEQVLMWRKDVMLAPESGRVNSKSSRDAWVKAAREGFNESVERDEEGRVLYKAGQDRIPNIEAAIKKMCAKICAPTGAGGQSLRDKMTKGGKLPPAERLVQYAADEAEFFHDPDRRAYVAVERDDHVENYGLDQEVFQDWLEWIFHRNEEARLIFAEEQRAQAMGDLYVGLVEDNIPPTPALRESQKNDAISKIRALARFRGREHHVHIRVAPGAAEGLDGIFFDLGDETWRAVHITKDGWEVVENPPVKFIRPNTMRALPVPKKSQSADALRQILNLPKNAEGDRHWHLILAWLVYSFVPPGLPAAGQYPILLLGGRKGSAKSTSEKILKMLLDPTKAPIRTKPQSERDLYVEADSCWCLAFNNFSRISDWLSNAFCNLSTGGGLGLRKLFTDRDMTVFDATRPLMINGIGEVVTRDDLLDRSIAIDLPDISDKVRKVEEDIFRRLEEIKPEVLGFIYSAIATGLGKVDDIPRENLPRMAGFTVWGIAIEDALGGEPGSFRRTYRAARGAAVEKSIEANPVIVLLFDFAENYTEENPRLIEPEDLWKELREMAGEELARTKDFPASASALMQTLNRLELDLQTIGIYAGRRTRSNKDKRRKVYYKPPGDGGDGGDGDGEDAVPQENPVDKGDSDTGGRGDGGDGTLSPIEDEEEEGEV